MLKMKRQDAYSWKGPGAVLGKTEMLVLKLGFSLGPPSLNKSSAQAHPRDSAVAGGVAAGGVAAPAGWGDVKSSQVSPL